MSLKVPALILQLAVALPMMGQPIAGANLRYWYDSRRYDDFKIQLVNRLDSLDVFYRCDTTKFTVRWERRDSYSERSGDELTGVTIRADKQSMSLPAPAKPWLLVAIVTDKADNETSLHYRLIEANYPVDCTISTANGDIVTDTYLYENTPYRLTGNASVLKVYCFAKAFPPATAPFTESSQEDPVLQPDSSFTIRNNGVVQFSKPGMFLIQSDTNAARGRAVLVVRASYPRLTRLEDLTSALIYLTTREEHERLIAAGKDKVKFDKVILDITRDKDRAKNMIRNYFRRVELANALFDSYKEGWKTDRGMCYVIFGPPDQVSRTGSSEIWTYKGIKAKLVFNRSASIYDPHNFVLQRDKRLMETWYYTIDMWRKNRVESPEQN